MSRAVSYSAVENITLIDNYSSGSGMRAGPSDRAARGVGLRPSPAKIVGSNPTGDML